MLSLSKFQKIELLKLFLLLIFTKPQFSQICNPSYCYSLCCSSQEICSLPTTDCQNSVCEDQLCINKCCINGQCGTYDECQSTQIIGIIILSSLLGIFAIAFLTFCFFAIYSRCKKRQITQQDSIDRNPQIITTNEIPFMETQFNKKEKIPLQEIVLRTQSTSRQRCSNPIIITYNKTMNTEQQAFEHIKGLPVQSNAFNDTITVTEGFEEVNGLESEISSSNAGDSSRELERNIDKRMHNYVQKQFKTIIKTIQTDNNEQINDDQTIKQRKKAKLQQSNIKCHCAPSLFQLTAENQQIQRIMNNEQESTIIQNSMSQELKQIKQQSRFIQSNQNPSEQNVHNKNENQKNQNIQQAYLSFSSLCSEK